jgi:PHD/YefM family antitoxin component YafN of YafNO toxin-antitoxin module
MNSVTSRQFNQDTSAAKRLAATAGPVFVTDRGKTTHVLMTIEEFDRLKSKRVSLAEALAHPESEHIDFDIPRMGDWGLKIPDFDDVPA